MATNTELKAKNNDHKLQNIITGNFIDNFLNSRDICD